MKKVKVLGIVAIMLGLLTVVGLFTESGLVKSAYAVYYGGCYYCKPDGGSGTCTCYDGAGGAFCHNNPCTLHFLCLPAN